MPRTPLKSLPDSSRLWVFSCEPALDARSEELLLAAADEFLDGWRAHGEPLTCARDWRDSRFLAIAVDQSQAGASGCSIDGLFRALRSLESSIAAKVVGGGSVFYRDAAGMVQCVSRDDFGRLAEDGGISASTMVFDTSITSLDKWHSAFEIPASQSWHSTLLPESQHRR